MRVRVIISVAVDFLSSALSRYALMGFLLQYLSRLPCIPCGVFPPSRFFHLDFLHLADDKRQRVAVGPAIPRDGVSLVRRGNAAGERYIFLLPPWSSSRCLDSTVLVWAMTRLVFERTGSGARA